jgi:hypothetical protein
MIGSNLQSVELLMMYLLEFIGFLTIAILLAASPLLVRAVELIRRGRPAVAREATAHDSSQARSEERSEIRNEIRRMTAVLEIERRGMQRSP